MTVNKSINLKAVIFMILSALSFAAMNTVVKYVHYLGVFEIVFFRAVTSLLICYLLLRHYGIPVIGKENKLLILRSVIGLTSMVFFFWGIKFLPLGIAVSHKILVSYFCSYFCLVYFKRKNQAHPMGVFSDGLHRCHRDKGTWRINQQFWFDHHNDICCFFRHSLWSDQPDWKP